jgi:serine/threonine-protein kinase
MGEVFRAVAVGEHGFEKPVVVKRVLPAHAGRSELLELFVAEAKLMTRLAHPNIVGVLDFGRGERADYYLVLELIEGVDLGGLLRAASARGEAFPVPLALFVASQILRGLHHAHTKLAGEGSVIVHRDVSPSNVLCSAEGEVKVADFGVALVSRGARRDGAIGVAGKPGYMAPEQLDGGEIDPRADVFSAGVVLFQMLTGELPFAGETPEERDRATRRGARARASEKRAEVSEAIEGILDRALAPSPAARFPDARAMAQAIEALRETGQRIATGDELAEAVRAAQKELPKTARPVIALGSEAKAEEIEGPTELTRIDAGGAFTLRFPVRADATTRNAGAVIERAAQTWDAPEPRTVRIDPNERIAPPNDDAGAAPLPAVSERESALPEIPVQRSRWQAVVGALLVVLVAGSFVLLFREKPERDARVPVQPTAPVSAVTLSALVPVASVSAAPVADPPAPVASTPVPRSSARPVAPKGSASAASSAAPATTATAALPDDCTGEVRLASENSWVVTGGPSTVQSPISNLRWPCRTYTLTATSRVDPTQKRTATLRVSPNSVAYARFE